MDRPAPFVGAAACLATLLAMAAPYVLLTDPGTGLGVYYGAGPLGAFGVAFLALLAAVAFLAGERGSAAPATASGVALALGLGTLALALLWALSVDTGNVLSFTAAWMGWHRWLLAGLSALVAASAGVYAREVL